MGSADYRSARPVAPWLQNRIPLCWLFCNPKTMSERRIKEQRKDAREFRVDVKRAEFDELRHLVVELTDRLSQLQRDLDDLRKKIRF
jgi:hypothetical protein